jgi:hypothetical protein
MKLLVRILVFALFVLGALVVSCSDGDSTTGKRIVLDVRVAASPESRDFTNAMGWNVRITKAAIATGAFYYFDGETLYARRGFFGIKTAAAHPGHYVPGNAKGEMLSSTSVDLLAGATIGSGAGVSGPVRSATFSFDTPAKGPFAAELGANVAIVEGTATKGAETRTFRAELGADEVKDPKGRTIVEGCPFVAADMQHDGVVSVAVKLSLWFDQIDFRSSPATGLLEGSAKNQLARSAKGSLAYVFAYAPR